MFHANIQGNQQTSVNNNINWLQMIFNSLIFLLELVVPTYICLRTFPAYTCLLILAYLFAT